MLIQPWDSVDDAEALDFVRHNEFGQLIAVGRGRDVPVVVPTQFLLADDETVLLHLARPNPVWHPIEENPIVLLAVTGDWAFIPGAWKKLPELDEDPAYGVPTTYYAAVQLVCRARIVDDFAEKAEILRSQLERLDPEGGLVDPAAHDRVLNGIRGLHLRVTEIRGKFKYGGNVDANHRQHVAEQLAKRDGPGDADARDHLLRRLDSPPRKAQRPQH
ncbi:transcriptional regulator [Longimycelium tulufanense]|uniref:Transcriptional regulator n=1 Tax=Longimycelium tulufanense TaxID=907463 RepID=A0A8J3CHF9_9PSEU|nr:FMN-binding negative transcriptional regulator [Longimycelium tulufanense]GGM67240.1 transcriptional regulator [Longimycelium tulufanense]